MHADQVAKRWVYGALCDLYCAFTLSDDWTFEDQERFLEIMGLEKLFKAVLLFHNRTQYEHLSDVEARVKLNKMAMALGHDVDKLLRGLRALNVDVDSILTSDFDGYKGADLVQAVKAGYMETRYPVPNLISEKFPIPGAPGVTHDPLSSSGFTKFVYALSGACYRTLSSKVDFSTVLSQFRDTYKHRGESLGRFEHLFLAPHCGV